MAKPVGPAKRQRLLDRGQTEGLPGVNREARVVRPHVFERVQMPRRRIAGFGTGDIETDDTPIAEPNGQLGDIARPRGMTHRRHQAPHRYGPTGSRGGLLPISEAGQYGLDHLIEGQPASQMQFGGEPDLRVHHVVRCEILDALQCDAVQRFSGLHHCDGVRERLEVADQRSAVRGSAEPGCQFRRIDAGQTVVADLPGDIDDRRGPQTAVQVIVQQRLGGLLDHREGQRSSHQTIVPGQPMRFCAQRSARGPR